MLVAGGLIPLACLPFYLWLMPESVRFQVVRKAPAERIARTLRRVVGSDGVSAATRFTISEQAVQGGAPTAALSIVFTRFAPRQLAAA